MKCNATLIKEYMKQNNLSEEKFCEKCHISLSTLKSILNEDNQPIFIVTKISLATKTKLSDLVK